MELERLNIIIQASTDPLKKGLDDVKRQMNSLEKTTSKSSKSMGQGLLSFKNIVKGLGIGLIFKTIASSMGDAISRLDTLNNYTKVMSNLGQSSRDADDALAALDKNIQGLPTKLNDAASAVQRFTAVNGNVKASTSMFVGLNNAMLAGGQPAKEVASAMEQAIQAYSKGKPDMQEWKAMAQVMPAQLNQIAKAMGYASQNDLGKALREGDVSMNKFMATITQLNGGVNGFAKQAKEATNGVGTSITNLKTAFSRGLANIMNELRQSNIAGFFQLITRAVNTCMNYIAAFVRVIMTAVSFVSKLFGKDTSKKAKDTEKGVDKVGSSVGKLGDNASSAGNSAKKLKKELAGLAAFDEMNVLKEPENSAAGSGDGSGGAGDLSGIDMSIFDDLEKGESAVDKAYNNIMKLIKKIGEEVNGIDFSGIVRHAKGIGKSLKEIFTDKKLLDSGKTFAEHWVKSLINFGSSVVQIGTNVAEWFLGSIDKYLSKNKDRIKKHITEMFKIGTEKLDIVDRAMFIVTELSIIFKGSKAKQIGADILAMFVNPLMSAFELVNKLTRDLANLIIQPIYDNLEQLKSTFGRILGPIQTVTGTLSEAWTYIGDLFNKVYDEHMKPFFDSLTKGMSDTFGKWLDVYNKHIFPFVDKTAKRIKELWDKHLKPLWDNIADFLGAIIDFLKVLWEKWLKPVIDWIIQNVIPVLMPILDTVGAAISAVFSIIVDVISGIISVLSGVLKFITGVFTGDWGKAWEGIKQIFSAPWNAMKSIVTTVINFIKTGISNGLTAAKNTVSSVMNTIKSVFTNVWNGIWNVVRGIINKIIGGVERMCNSVIRGINKMFAPLAAVGNKILSAVGIKSFSFSPIGTVSLPRLAKGGIVDKPTIAQIGENGPEAIVPLKNNTEWIDNLASIISEKSGSNGEPSQIIVKIGEETIFNKVIDKAKKKAFERNGGVFEV